MASVKVPVDGTRMVLISTGKVHKVPVWDDVQKRMIQGSQARDPETNGLLWSIDCVPDDGDESSRSEAVGVRVPVLGESAPLVSKWQPVNFEGLEIAVRTNRAGGFTCYWSARGVVPAAPGRRGGGEG